MDDLMSDYKSQLGKRDHNEKRGEVACCRLLGRDVAWAPETGACTDLGPQGLHIS